MKNDFYFDSDSSTCRRRMFCSCCFVLVQPNLFPNACFLLSESLGSTIWICYILLMARYSFSLQYLHAIPAPHAPWCRSPAQSLRSCRSALSSCFSLAFDQGFVWVLWVDPQCLWLSSGLPRLLNSTLFALLLSTVDQCDTTQRDASSLMLWLFCLFQLHRSYVHLHKALLLAYPCMNFCSLVSSVGLIGPISFGSSPASSTICSWV